MGIASVSFGVGIHADCLFLVPLREGEHLETKPEDVFLGCERQGQQAAAPIHLSANSRSRRVSRCGHPRKTLCIRRNRAAAHRRVAFRDAERRFPDAGEYRPKHECLDLPGARGGLSFQRRRGSARKRKRRTFQYTSATNHFCSYLWKSGNGIPEFLKNLSASSAALPR